MLINDIFYYFFGGYSIKEILYSLILISLLYLITFSNTGIGYLIRGFLIIIIIYTFHLYIQKGEFLYAIYVALIQTLIFFFPLIIKYSFLLLINSIKYLSRKISL
jgi:hypothetical protein